MGSLTVTVQGVGGDNLALHGAVVQATPGSVLVVDVGGASYGHWGEVLTVAAQHRGLTGLLIDGGSVMPPSSSGSVSRSSRATTRSAARARTSAAPSAARSSSVTSRCTPVT
jgi:hypothetical protein